MTDRKIEGLVMYSTDKNKSERETVMNPPERSKKEYFTWSISLPSINDDIIEKIRERLNSNDSFHLYEICDNAQYLLEIKDFFYNEDKKECIKEFRTKYSTKEDKDKIRWYPDPMYKYNTVFLAKSMKKLNNPIPINNFEFYEDYEYTGELFDLCPYTNIIKKTTDNQIEDAIIQITDKNMPTLPLNQILYGPPGTGKTYHTINKALAIIENKTEEELEIEDRKDLKKRFDDYVTEGSIVFTTFHQSMSYEDFIEGIKPIEPQNEGDNMTYKVVDGILKRLSIDASFAIAQQKKSENIVEIIDFSTQYEDYIGKIDERLLQGEKIKIKTKSNAMIFIDSISPNRNIIVRHIEGTRTYIVSKDRLTKIHQAFSELDDINNIDSQFRGVIGGSNASAYWAILNDIRKTPFDSKKTDSLEVYTQNEKKEVMASMLKSDFEYKNAEKPKPFVLIIDEINRGNVSQIFGELITLIEEDKRLGKDEALTVTLPYSKEKFGVPSNVYIIGTMNTADRSVEALDTALRRRFSFVEMPPQYNVIKTNEEIEFDLSKILRTINDRIEVLLNKDNLIGHSYFMSVETLDDLKSVFQNKIMPLLQEYFFGDYGKIGLVLGSGFVQKEVSKDNIFSDFAYDGGNDDFSSKLIYRLIDAEKMNDEVFKTAIDNLINDKKINEARQS